MATETAAKLTYEDYANTPEGERYELIDGELILLTTPNTIHQSVRILLGWQFMPVEKSGLGRVYPVPLDVALSDHDVVQPDLQVILKENAHIITEANVQGAPDLVVEIVSQETARRDWYEKRDLYAKHGVGELWIVDPDARIVWVMTLRDGEYGAPVMYKDTQTFSSPTLAGVTIDLRKVFEE